MKFRFALALPAAIVATALLAPGMSAQGRGGARAGGGGGGGARGMRSGGRAGEREALGGPFRRGYYNGYGNYGYWYPPYLFPDDEYDYPPYGPPPQDAPPPPAQNVTAQPVQSPAPPTIPVEPLLLEIRDGQWVRVPTGSQMAIAPSGSGDSAPVANSHPGITEPAEQAPPVPELPPALIVFRDGRTEEVAKYMIQGGDLYTSGDYWNTGTWTRKIPLADLDIPSTLKLNKARGTKFNLPSGPSEVVIRF